jgi:hypothetical protein
MVSKHGIAKAAIVEIQANAVEQNIGPGEVLEALLSQVVLAMTEAGVDDLRGLLQYEMENVRSDGLHELPRGGGHS